MPTRRLPDSESWDFKVCRDPEHNPPSHWCPQPGTYEHTCPSCGETVVFTVGVNFTR